MASILSDEADKLLREYIDRQTTGAAPEIPGLLYQAVDAKGNVLFKHASGRRGLASAHPMTLDTIFYLASFTKLITSIACMQLVEQGMLRLDDASQVLDLAPELGNVQVLERTDGQSFRLVPKERDVTLRMLMTHTAGFGYAFEDFKLRDWARPIGLDDFSGIRSDVFDRPLVNQPGLKFQYGTSMDWVGFIIERASGKSLEQYFEEHIFKPANIKDIRFYPSPEMKTRMAFMHQRERDGSLTPRDHLLRRPLVGKESSEGKPYCMAGAGCFGSPIEWCKLLCVLLNDGTSPDTRKQLLRPETVEEMFKDQIPDKPRPCDESWPSANPLLANGTPLTPQPPGLTEGWGLSFSLSHSTSVTGRATGTASWEGMANLFWFVDRKTGVAGMIAAQILPYGDARVIALGDYIETKLYEALRSSKAD